MTLVEGATLHREVFAESGSLVRLVNRQGLICEIPKVSSNLPLLTALSRTKQAVGRWICNEAAAADTGQESSDWAQNTTRVCP